METDPFTQVYVAMWDTLKQSPIFMQEVRPGNRISFVEDREYDPRKAALPPGRSPEVSIYPDYWDALNPQDSSSVTITRNYQIIIRTDTLMLNKVLQPLEFAIFRVFSCGEFSKILTNLQFEGKKFVTQSRLLVGSQTVPELTDKADFVSWRSVANLAVTMNFTF